MTDEHRSVSKDERTCACHSRDAYDCWASRYDMDVGEITRQSIDDDGGPCQCDCHDQREEDYDPAEYL